MSYGVSREQAIVFSRRETFVLKQGHLDLMKHMYVDWGNCEFGAPAINCKRPYGDGDVLESIIKILLPALEDYGDEMPQFIEEAAKKWHAEMLTALQIVLCTQQFRLGTYKRAGKYKALSWEYQQDL